jgi:hypothetical protein
MGTRSKRGLVKRFETQEEIKMELTVIILGGATCFAAGVVFGKVVLSDLAAIKTHVTNEVAKLRGDLSSTLTGAAKKL